MSLPAFPCDIHAFTQHVPFQKISWSITDAANIPLYIRRDDLIDKAVSGNKFYKLYGHLMSYFHSGRAYPVASFGGAYSNHLYALAAAGNHYGFKTVGIVRGEPPKVLSETLIFCQSMGMKIHFISRHAYKNKALPGALEKFNQDLGGQHYWIPEGGGGERGRLGAKALGLSCGEFANTLQEPTTFITACGTATTFSAMVMGAKSSYAQFVGVPVLKTGQPYLNDIKHLLKGQKTQWALWQNEGHCGGYAKFPQYLEDFLRSVESEINIVLDPIYTIKIFWALDKAIQSGLYKKDTPVVLIHSGGLQGRDGFKQLK